MTVEYTTSSPLYGVHFTSAKEVMFTRRLSVFLSALHLLAASRKTADHLHENSTKDVSLDKKDIIKC